MDNTEKYIKMCDKSPLRDKKIPLTSFVMVKKCWATDKNTLGIIVEIPTKDWCLYSLFLLKKHNPYGGFERKQLIWLPRQDQLQDMVGDIEKSYRVFWKRTCCVSSFRNIPNIDIITNSWEQLWLGIVMYEKYNKIWDDKKEEWNLRK